MHAMDDMDVPVSVKVEDGEYSGYDEYDECSMDGRYSTGHE